MSLFVYQARDPRGSLVRGQLEAGNRLLVREKLQALGLFPIKISQRPFQKVIETFQRVFVRVRLEDKIAMTRQLYTLFKAGMNIDEILTTLEKQTRNPTLKKCLGGARDRVADGSSLSAALTEYPQVFGHLYVNLIMAGEESGILEKVLRNLSTLLQKEAELKSRVKSALLYPKIVVFVLLVASTLMLTMVIPKFEGFYARFGATLPLPTRILIGLGNFAQDFWWLVAAILIGLLLLFRRYIRSKPGRIRWGRLLFRVPVFGPLNQKVANARFCHLLAALYGSGLPMTRSVELCSEAIDNGYFAQEIGFIRGAIYQGKTLSEAMRSCRSFTPVIVDATGVGETSGSLDDILIAMGEHYDTEIEYTLKNLTTLLEPILLFVIFGMVTLFALAVFLPMWNMSQAVLGGGQ